MLLLAQDFPSQTLQQPEWTKLTVRHVGGVVCSIALTLEIVMFKLWNLRGVREGKGFLPFTAFKVGMTIPKVNRVRLAQSGGHECPPYTGRCAIC